ncbi:uncharacterized protein ACBT44_003094 isoform 2-T2 [Syngnathus typhle]
MIFHMLKGPTTPGVQVAQLDDGVKQTTLSPCTLEDCPGPLVSITRSMDITSGESFQLLRMEAAIRNPRLLCGVLPSTSASPGSGQPKCQLDPLQSDGETKD